jgi:RNA polymerase sigma-70 factor (ECF subfamily)
VGHCDWGAGGSRRGPSPYRRLAQLYRTEIDRLRSYLARILKSDADAEDVALPPSPALSAEAEIVAREQEHAYARALDALPARCRQVIELRTVQELSYKQMSDSLGISVSTLEKHLVRGKRVCAEALADWAVAA